MFNTTVTEYQSNPSVVENNLINGREHAAIPINPIGPMRSRMALKIDHNRDRLITEFGHATLQDSYLLTDETPQLLYQRVATWLGSNPAHAQRLYDYMSKQWFTPATPILANTGNKRGQLISCFLNEADDTLQSIADLWHENVWLAAKGGGIGSYWGNLRSIGEAIGRNGKTSGIIPFIKVMDSTTLAIGQGSLRRGNAAVYLPIDHPEIEEFIDIRQPTGGDPNRKSINIHHGVTISDKFMQAMLEDKPFDLVSPKDQTVIRTLSARKLWIKLLTTRLETGEPYFLFQDTVARATPEHHRILNLIPHTSNLCSEITLPTGIDHLGKDRTAVCCLSSLNLELWDAWKNDKQFIADVMEFLDNALTEFIETAPPEMAKAVYSASRERSVGCGVLGWHSLLQSKQIPFESAIAKGLNLNIFKHIRRKVEAASYDLAKWRGACPDAAEVGIMQRFSYKLALVPTASVSIICGGTSPSIEPIVANAFIHKTKAGSFIIKNKYLKRLLRQFGKDNDVIWTNIMQNRGSVQQLEFLTEQQKMVFKTAFELDQRWLLEFAADRAPLIDQAQSLNIFALPNINKTDLHLLHIMAWRLGIKSLYYFRSLELQKAENATLRVDLTERRIFNTESLDECLACQ